MKGETKRKASNAMLETSLAPYVAQHNVLPINSDYNSFVYCIAIDFCIVL